MILFITSKFDPHVDYLIDHLQDDFYRFNTDDFLDYHQLNFEISNNSLSVKIDNKSGSSFDFSKITSVYYRRPTIPEAIDNIKNTDVRQLIERETKDTLRQLYYSFPNLKWICAPWKIEFSRGRMNQLVQASNLGFKIPNTLITTSKSEFINFFNRCNRKVIIKTINAGSCVKVGEISEPIYTEVIDSKSINNFDLGLIENSPCLFQQFIDAEYELRITSIGSEHLAVKIVSDITDWRKLDAKIKYTKYELPEKICDLLSSYLEYYDLNFGCFDLIKGKDGEYYFLELNPNGQWLWLEIATGIPIGETIVNYLLGIKQ